MTIFALVLFALCAVPNVISNTAIKVPVLFVTEKDIASGAKEINYFNLRLCGGCLYDKQVAKISINQPNKPWSVIVGDFVKCYVTDASGHQIATNKDGDTFVDTFSFTYSKAYGDLRLTCVTANTPAGVVYTISVSFNKNATVDDTPSCQPRYFSTEEEIMSWRDMEKNVQLEKYALNSPNIGKTYELVSIFLTTSTGSITTQKPLLLELDYCFIIGLLPGTIVVSVTAMDEQSGFATYACPAHIRPCTTESTPFSDISGAAVNFVVANITQKEDVGPVQILIRGDGRFGNKNIFRLAASKYFH